MEAFFWNVVGSVFASAVFPPAGAAGVSFVLGPTVPDWLLGAVAALVAVVIFLGTRQAARRSSNQRFADTLTKHYEKGVHQILNLPVSDMHKWGIDRDAWIRELKEMMEAQGCSKQETSYVETLHIIPLAKWGEDSDEKDKEKTMFSMRLERLKKIIDTYAVRPIFTTTLTRDVR